MQEGLPTSHFPFLTSNFLLLTSAVASVPAFPSETCISSRCSSQWIYIRFSVFFCFVFFTNMSGHFKTSLEFYACDWIKTLWKQQYSQIPINSFFLHFQCLFVVEQAPVSDHLTLISLLATYKIISSLKRPAPGPFTVLILKFAAPVTDNFFRLWGVYLRELVL